jgi:hypothetical protein
LWFDLAVVDRTSRLNGQKMSPICKGGDELREVFLNHRLAAGDDDVLNARPLRRLFQDGAYVAGLASGLPGCMRRVTPGATQVTAGGANENRRQAGIKAFALKAVENLRD